MTAVLSRGKSSAYGRSVLIELRPAVCHVCDCNKLCVSIDTSDDEYGPGNICRDCADDAFSAGLLQSQLSKLSQEHFQVRNVLLAIIKQQGRIKVDKAILDGLSNEDACESRELPDAIVFEYKKSDMIVPEGVSNGKANGPKGAA
jgi:hypothetical protein